MAEIKENLKKRVLISYGKYLGFFEFSNKKEMKEYIAYLNGLSFYHFNKSITYKKIDLLMNHEDIKKELNSIKQNLSFSLKRKTVFINMIDFTIDGHKILDNIKNEYNIRKKEINKILNNIKKNSQLINKQKEIAKTNNVKVINVKTNNDEIKKVDDNQLLLNYDMIYYCDASIYNKNNIVQILKNKKDEKIESYKFTFEKDNNFNNTTLLEKVGVFLSLKNILLNKSIHNKKIAIICDNIDALKQINNIKNYIELLQYNEDNEDIKTILFNKFFNKDKYDSEVSEKLIDLIKKLKANNIKIHFFHTKGHKKNLGNLLVDNIKYINFNQFNVDNDFLKLNYNALVLNEFGITNDDKIKKFIFIPEQQLNNQLVNLIKLFKNDKKIQKNKKDLIDLIKIRPNQKKLFINNEISISKNSNIKMIASL